MKAIKYILSAVILFSVIWSCNDDKFGDIEFVDSVVAPSNLIALFDVTQDNTGLVTITPNGDGAATYQVFFGDDSITPADVKQGESVEHTYAEGTYDVKLVATGITGLKSEGTTPLTVSFKAPENLEVVIENDAAVSKQLNVTATADLAISYDVYFGEEGKDDPVTGNIGETVSYAYEEAGIYTIRVVAKGAAIQTTEFTTEFEAIAIVQPIAAAPEPPLRADVDVISIFSSKYTDVADTNYFPDWGQGGQGSGWAMFDLAGDEMLNYINLSYQGISFGSTQDVSSMEYIHLDVWTADEMQIETSLINGVDGNSTEAPVMSDLTKDEWTSIEIPLSEWTDQGLSIDQIFQLKFVGEPWAAGTVFIDNIYFYRAPSAVPTGIVGTWKMAPEAGSLGVGPGLGDTSWWAIDAAGVDARACYFDDEFVFSADGTFMNVLGGDTWVEGWQGGGDACGAPVAPHDGSNPATFTYDETAGTVTLNGLGSYLGIPKAVNGLELDNPANTPATVTYDVTLFNNDTQMTVDINVGGGWWRYQLVKDNGGVTPPPTGGDVIDFEPGSTEYVWTGFGASDFGSIPAAVIANPDASGINTSTQVVEIQKLAGAQVWAGASTPLDGYIDWSNGTTIKAKVWSPRAGTPILLKIEDLNSPKDGNGNPSVFAEVIATSTVANGWEELSFDMATFGSFSTSINYGNIIFFPDFGNPGNGENFYFDDVTVTITGSTGGGGGGGGNTDGYDLTMPIDFETDGYGAAWTWNVFENDSNPALEFVANPDASGANTSSTVAKITALQAGQPWVGTETAHGEMGITWDLSADNAFIKIMVYKTVISDVGIKLVNPAGGGQVEIKVANTKVNEWEELTFDFSSRIGNGLDGSTNIDQIVVFPDFNLDGRTADNVVYFDNITFGSN